MRHQNLMMSGEFLTVSLHIIVGILSLQSFLEVIVGDIVTDELLENQESS